MLFLSIVLLISASYFFWFSDGSRKGSLTGNVVDNTFFENSDSCSDSDGGTYTYQRGTLSATNFLGIRGTYRDTCEDKDGKDAVREYFCQNGKAHSQIMACEQGCNAGACILNGGLMKVSVRDADSEQAIPNAEVTLYDDSLTEIEVQKTGQDGSAVFKNTPLKPSQNILDLYQERGIQAPQVFRFDSRTYSFDISALGYEPQVVDMVFTEGNDTHITVALQRTSSLNSVDTITGYAIADKGEAIASDGETISPMIQYPEEGDALLKLAPQAPFADKSRCRILVEGLRASPFPEDRKPFTIKGFLRTTKHCSGTYHISVSFDPENSATIKGKGRIPFALGPLTQSYGNAVGGLACPSITLQEIVGGQQSAGVIANVDFRLPVLACNDPNVCSTGTRCIPEDEEVDTVDSHIVAQECESTLYDPEKDNYKTVKGKYISRQTACESYFKGDCGNQSRGRMCEFEGQGPRCTSPKNGGAPGGGAQRLLELSARKYIGKQCCFCGYDTKLPSAAVRFQCNSFFDGAFGFKATDPSFKCEVREMIPILQWDQKLQELSERHLCKTPINAFIIAHGNPDPNYKGPYPIPADKVLTCENTAELIGVCISNFPEKDIVFKSNACEVFRYTENAGKYLKVLESYLGEDQVVDIYGNVLDGFFRDKDSQCTLQQHFTVAPKCSSGTPSSCKEANELCAPSNNIEKTCIDKEGKQTKQQCCPASLSAINQKLAEKKWWDYPERQKPSTGIFSHPGKPCPPIVESFKTWESFFASKTPA